MPLLSQMIGKVVAVILTALLFAVLHQPADLVHWLSFTATAVAYGWIRVASRSTAASAIMHHHVQRQCLLLRRVLKTRSMLSDTGYHNFFFYRREGLPDSAHCGTGSCS
ncbi:MAG TPA: CPBP family intramembrane glutamic endopeptidase, partial [Terriglobales bacterium]|nr:CPBP family intramembrane glutamic endopeptidase [Terriglobales bacterium]